MLSVSMKVRIEENCDVSETEIFIKCRRRDPQVRKILRAVNALNFSLLVFKDEKRLRIPVDDIFYIESVDDRTFVYSARDVFECALRLYEAETLTKEYAFARINKSAVVNIRKISCIRPQPNGRFEAELSNGLRQIVNRHYVRPLKEKFEEVFN